MLCIWSTDYIISLTNNSISRGNEHVKLFIWIQKSCSKSWKEINFIKKNTKILKTISFFSTVNSVDGFICHHIKNRRIMACTPVLILLQLSKQPLHWILQVWSLVNLRYYRMLLQSRLILHVPLQWYRIFRRILQLYDLHILFLHTPQIIVF